jgi:GntR family transcriptional regulator
VPIYRQIVDQIKCQIATGLLKRGDKLPSVRRLAGDLAVNQNTVLKVYTQLCGEKILETDRGNGTFVAASASSLPLPERRQIVSRLLGEAVVQAIHFDLSAEQLHELLDREYRAVKPQLDRGIRALEVIREDLESPTRRKDSGFSLPESMDPCLL